MEPWIAEIAERYKKAMTEEIISEGMRRHVESLLGLQTELPVIKSLVERIGQTPESKPNHQ